MGGDFFWNLHSTFQSCVIKFHYDHDFDHNHFSIFCSSVNSFAKIDHIVWFAVFTKKLDRLVTSESVKLCRKILANQSTLYLAVEKILPWVMNFKRPIIGCFSQKLYEPTWIFIAAIVASWFCLATRACSRAFERPITAIAIPCLSTWPSSSKHALFTASPPSVSSALSSALCRKQPKQPRGLAVRRRPAQPIPAH